MNEKQLKHCEKLATNQVANLTACHIREIMDTVDDIFTDPSNEKDKAGLDVLIKLRVSRDAESGYAFKPRIDFRKIDRTTDELDEVRYNPQQPDMFADEPENKEISVKTISEAQAKRLMAISDKMAVSLDEIKAYLADLNINDIAEIPANVYDEVIAWIEGHAKAKEPKAKPEAMPEPPPVEPPEDVPAFPDDPKAKAEDADPLFDLINNSKKVSWTEVETYLQMVFSASLSIRTLKEKGPTIHANLVSDWNKYEQKIADYTKETGGTESKNAEQPLKNRCEMVIPGTEYRCVLEAGHSGQHKISDADKEALKMSHPEIYARLLGNADQQPEQPEQCGHVHADGVRKCIKEKGHDGQHRYQ
ncbi:MAG: hypothetical protein JXR78_01815 [Victivallales bacterium]|nr:hypothetical protein [Victivallales bacterium]